MIQREHIAAAATAITPHIRHTPVLEVPPGTLGIDATLTFKLEHMQISGTFKIRGVLNTVLSHPEAAKSGLIAASGGNHGIAVAMVAKRLGVRAKIFVPTIAGAAKRQRLQALGAEVVVEGDVYKDTLAAARKEAESTGLLILYAFEARETIIGAGTLGPELEEQARPDMIALAVGGGGLAAGLAAWFGDRVPLLCTEPVSSPTLHVALSAGEPVDVETGGIAADALGCARVGDIPFSVLSGSRVISELVKSDDVLRAQTDLWDELRIAVEPAAAVALAGVRALPTAALQGKRIAVVLCGANLDPASLSRTPSGTGWTGDTSKEKARSFSA